MNITVEILSRTAVDQPFTRLVAPTILTMTADTLGFSPALPAGSEALELRLRVQSDDSVNVDIGAWLDPAHPPQPSDIFDANGVKIGQTPVPSPAIINSYGAWERQPRDIPFEVRSSFRFRRLGVAP